ncbi:MAG: glycosyltransferase family 2 protein [Patescibacteria group bacterium]
MTYGSYRGLETIPALLIWGAFALAVALSFFAPIFAIGFIIIFDSYWMFRVLYFVVFVLISWHSFREARKIDWLQKLKLEVDDFEQYWHLVFLPTYKEPKEVIEATLKSLLASSYPKSRMMILLGGEERDKEAFLKIADEMKAKYGESFARFFITVHSANLPDEIPGKGSNMNFMGREVKKYVDEIGLPYSRIIVSAFDVDTLAHKDYFAHLAFVYATAKNQTRASYQPVVLFNNNMWESPAPVRVMAFGTTFWLMGELARPERLWTFSSHSMPFQMLVDVGFWQKDIVSEDSRIFLQALKRYQGDYRVEPLYLPVSMDAVASAGYLKSLVALYKQQRRWAWGVEHFPYIVVEIWRDKAIAFKTRFRVIFNHIEGMFTWATAPVLIFILGWLPIYVAGQNPDVLVYNAPFTLQWMMRVAAVGVFVFGAVSFTLLPHRPDHAHPWRFATMVLQWVLLPVTFIILGAIPAIDAQTRLAFGKYLGFNVTEKRREKKN